MSTFASKLTLVLALCAVAVTTVTNAQGTPPMQADVEAVNYTGLNNTDLQGFVSMPDDASDDGTTPAVIIIPDWDGVNEYEQIRATMVAKQWNFVGFAADIYGPEFHTVEDMDTRITLATKYRSDPELFISRIQNAVDVVKNMTSVDPTKIALMGYCFGGTGVLSYLLLGNDEVAGIVSVHGGLSGLPANDTVVNSTTLPDVLVLSGGEDDTATAIMDLEMTLDETGAEWEITRYSGIEHAFTVYQDERYNQWADERSWDSTAHFLQELFNITTFRSKEPSEAQLNDETIMYTDIDGMELQGYLATPSTTQAGPCVVVIPDWDGNNMYERQRANLLAEYGYVGFAADIYGADNLEVEDIDTRIELANMYRSNATLFIQRIERAIEEVKESDSCDGENIALAGYCFGGTGNIHYAFSGRDDVKVIAAFHGGLTSLPNVTGDITPYILVLSGGDDDAHGNQTELEMALDEGNARWEITRWSGVDHGFTVWDSDAYNVRADIRSWDQFMTAMVKLMPPPTISASNGGSGDSSSNGGSSDGSESGASSFAGYYFTVFCCWFHLLRTC